jgi:hypothetical protein
MSGGTRESRAARVAYWRGLMEEHSRSGLAVPAFCKERGLSVASFYQWRKKLQGLAEPAVATLLPVKLVSTSVQQPAGKGCIQILTPAGMSLAVSAATAEEDLVKLLRAIHEASRSC